MGAEALVIVIMMKIEVVDEMVRMDLLELLWWKILFMTLANNRRGLEMGLVVID